MQFKLLLLVAILFTTVSAQIQSSPNLIFLLADDQRADALSCAGHPLIQTPNLDALAQQGQRFVNAYTVAPICKPSRVSFMLGQYQRTHGVGFSTGKKMDEAQWQNSYPEKLRQAGYFTGFIGKFGVDSYSFKGKGSEKFDYWMAHDAWSKFFPKENENTAIYKQFKSDIITEIMGEAMLDFLEKAPSDKPFCLSVSFSAPHASTATSMMDKANGGWSMLKASNENPKIKDHPIYGSLFRDREVKAPMTMDGQPEKYLPLHVMNAEHGRQKCYSYDYKLASLKEHKYRYAQLIHGIDVQIGKLVEQLKSKGLYENTVIIYSSDNGLLMGDYNQAGKGLIYDLSAKVPFIVFDPRLKKELQGTVNDSLILSIDLAPTLLTYAGIEVPETMQGQKLQNVLKKPGSGRESVSLESLFALRGNSLIEGQSTKKWKYIKYFRTPDQIASVAKQEGRKKYDFRYKMKDVDFQTEAHYEQLFDLQKDPGETTNLASNPEYRHILQKLRAQHKTQSQLIAQNQEWHNHSSLANFFEIVWS